MIATTLPTTDLYFRGSCRGWIRRWWRSGSIERMGANSFRSGSRFLLIRRDKPDLMERAIDWPGLLVYLIDDDIDGALRSSDLPYPYRMRLAEFANRYYDRLIRRADIIVASSDVLAAQLREDPRVHADIIRADPYWTLPMADQRHFPRSADADLEFVHLGSASHTGGLAAITPAVIAALDRFTHMRFTFMGSRGSHPDLETHDRVRRIDVMGWRRYRRWLPRQRFHLALYPLAPTPFDRARSANKIFEHAIVGAVGIYPQDWSPAGLVAGGAFLAPAEPGDWEDTLFRATEQRSSLADMAKTAAMELIALRTDSAQRQLWADLLNVSKNGQSR